MVGPKSEVDRAQGKRYHAIEKPKPGGGTEWYFEERDCHLTPTKMLLARVMVAKIEDSSRLIDVLRGTPVQNKPGWNCVTWIEEALANLQQDGKALGTSVIDWGKVRDAVMAYCQRKRDEHRFDGKGNFDMSKVPTYDLIEGKEVVP